MFAYVVKRLLAGVRGARLVSMAIFLLFWYGPSSPAQPICDRETSNRCRPVRLERYERRWATTTPCTRSTASSSRVSSSAATITIFPTDYDCPAPCLGYSYRTKVPVWDEMKERLPATLSVAFGGAALYLLFGVPIGVAAARRRGTSGRQGTGVSSFLVLSSIPYYLFALLTWLYLTLIFQIPLFSDTGYFPFTDNPAKWFSGMLLAWIALGIYGCTSTPATPAGAMVETLSEDYIRTAKAKGLPPRTVVYKHALRAALVPVVTIFGIDFGTLLAGTIFTERIFEIEGIGSGSLQAVVARDLPGRRRHGALRRHVLIISNIIVDVVYSVLDPRVRLS